VLSFELGDEELINQAIRGFGGRIKRFVIFYFPFSIFKKPPKAEGNQ